MATCMICLGQGGCCLRKICHRHQCSLRIHSLCYYRWYSNGDYSDRCPCGDRINTYRFGLPPSCSTIESFQNPSLNLPLGEVPISTSNRWYCGATRCISIKYRENTKLIWYFIWLFIVTGYWGKICLYPLTQLDPFNSWSTFGFSYHIVGCIVSFTAMIAVKICIVSDPESTIPVSNPTATQIMIPDTVTCQTSI